MGRGISNSRRFPARGSKRVARLAPCAISASPSKSPKSVSSETRRWSSSTARIRAASVLMHALAVRAVLGGTGEKLDKLILGRSPFTPVAFSVDCSEVPAASNSCTEEPMPINGCTAPCQDAFSWAVGI